MSRRTKFTEPVKERVIEAITNGSTYIIAAEYAGISDVTLYNWIRKGQKQTKGNFRDFLDQLKAAEAHSAMSALRCINTAVEQGNLKAAFFLVERRHNYKRDTQHVRANQIKETAAKQERQIPTIKESMKELIKE